MKLGIKADPGIFYDAVGGRWFYHRYRVDFTHSHPKFNSFLKVSCNGCAFVSSHSKDQDRYDKCHPPQQALEIFASDF